MHALVPFLALSLALVAFARLSRGGDVVAARAWLYVARTIPRWASTALVARWRPVTAELEDLRALDGSRRAADFARVDELAAKLRSRGVGVAVRLDARAKPGVMSVDVLAIVRRRSRRVDPRELADGLAWVLEMHDARTAIESIVDELGALGVRRLALELGKSQRWADTLTRWLVELEPETARVDVDSNLRDAWTAYRARHGSEAAAAALRAAQRFPEVA